MRELETTLTDQLLGPILDRDPASPRITFYDDATGARIELSGATLANWAAKTANLICDEFGLGHGARVTVLLPAHWQTAAVLLGCWWAGTEVVLGPDDDAELALVTNAGLDAVSNAPEIAVLSLDPLGAPVPGLPPGITDYATSVRMHGDAFRPRGTGPALNGMSATEIADLARESAAAQGISATDRVLSSGEWDTASGLVDGLLAPLSVGASLVQVANPDPALVERRVQTEKVTVQR
ncbi:TIGR03089 family protein [Aldersonia sp. NBC_00410]|uniref:TIGR03089 family protein n=1 Tax=Aldersonia sp. NBC_00410 TaxID=2975954 RepID=UPI0022588242|nr:TIGR03089 family protein [Aldersonia sp. NBC_00410]MCX5044524.1 TIGR03089 family protein [Aldersonia sp. NBC_00410]